MDGEERQFLLDELWSAEVLGPAAAVGLDASEPRQIVACRLLMLLASLDPHANPDLNGEQVPDQFLRAYPIWQLLAHDLGGWLLKSGFQGNLGQASRSSQDLLKSLLEMQQLTDFPGHSEAVDPVPVLLPRQLRKVLVDGLGALRGGETPEIFEPRVTGRHDTPWSWDQMRAGALERVAFRRGQGFSAGDAMEHVAQAMGVSAQTLRGWERSQQLKEGCDLAQSAGRLKSQLDDDPDYGKRQDQALNAHVLERLKAFQAEPLAVFGQRYRERFGHRHNQGQNGGD